MLSLYYSNNAYLSVTFFEAMDKTLDLSDVHLPQLIKMNIARQGDLRR